MLNRPVYSLHRAVRRARSGRANEPINDKYELDTVVLESRTFERPFIEEYLRERYGDPRRAGNSLVWRVRPSARLDGVTFPERFQGDF